MATIPAFWGHFTAELRINAAQPFGTALKNGQGKETRR
jgi:hypothetical protein